MTQHPVTQQGEGMEETGTQQEGVEPRVPEGSALPELAPHLQC